MQEKSFILRACDFITKYSIYTLLFLIPIFFLPWTTDVLDFNKQALLILLVFVSLFATMLKILISGKFEINKSPINIVVGILFLVYLLATIFSMNRYGSFWGWPQPSSESLLSLTGFLIVYFLVGNIFTKKNIFTSIVIISISALIAGIIGIFQLFGLFIVPFSFAKSISFNTIGSVGSLGFFAAILIPLTMMMLIVSKKWWKILFSAELILFTLILFAVDYSVVWWVVLISLAVVMAFGMMKRNLFDGRWMALPMFFLAISLFFILLNPQIPWITQKANEIFLSQKASLNISLQTIKERPIFGSGPGTFAYDFSKFKDPSFSQSSLWNITFNQAASRVLDSLASVGILGFIALLAFLALPLFYGVKFLISDKNFDSNASQKDSSGVYRILTFGIFATLAAQVITYFLYSSNIVFNFLNFFMIAALVGLITQGKTEYELKPSSLTTLIVTFVFTLVFIFGFGLLILDGQRYLAETNYYQGLSAYQSGQKANGLQKLESAASLNPELDLYFRQLSQAYLLGLQDELQSTKSSAQGTVSDQEKTKIQNLVSNSINAGKIATDLNPEDVNNWSSRGYVYQNLISVSSDAQTWAISSYDSALKLDPADPSLFFQEGSVYLSSALNLSSDQKDQKNQLLTKAQGQLEKAVALNPSYSDALYSLGIVYDSLGQKDKAINAFTQLQQLNPTNTDIPKILANLKAGGSVLQSATPPTENPTGGTTGTVTNTTSKENSTSSKTTTSSALTK